MKKRKLEEQTLVVMTPVTTINQRKANKRMQLFKVFQKDS